jgi:lipopolysaccharide biosynthesis glycosyltransferase
VIDIVCAADHRFAMPLAVTLRSAAENCSQPIRAFVLNMDLSARTRRQIENACTNGHRPPKLIWIDADQNYMRNMPRGMPHLSQAAYLRLSMGRLLPPELDRALYLDSDVLVVKDLAPLWNTALDGNVIGAVRDFTAVVSGVGDVLGEGMKSVGMSRSDPMFNSGVLLVDLRAYREQNIEEQCVAFVARFGHEIRFADQDALNAVLFRRWKMLDFRWNLQMGTLDELRNHPQLNAADRESLHNDEPAVLHFTGAAKPWNSGLRSRYCLTYVRYVQQLGWHGQSGFRFWQAWRFVKCVRTLLVNRWHVLAAHFLPRVQGHSR